MREAVSRRVQKEGCLGVGSYAHSDDDDYDDGDYDSQTIHFYLFALGHALPWAVPCAANVMLEQTVERVVVGDKYCDKPLGLYVIRGENVVLLGTMVGTTPLSLSAASRCGRAGAPPWLPQGS